MKEADEVLELALVSPDGTPLFKGEEEEYLVVKGDRGYRAEH